MPRIGLLLAASCLICPALARAETPDADSANNDSHAIIVTATKKAQAEDVQAVPLAITAFDAQALEARQLRDLQSLSHAAPGISLDQIGTFRGVANFAVRGLGVNSSIASVDPAVGTFVDGVYLGVNAGAVFELFDVDSVELLRGPQGVLFGRNTTGGAVVLNTADPKSEWGGRVRISGDGPASSGRGALNMTAQASVTGPLSDSLAFRIAAYHNTDGGYFRNRFNNSAFGKADTNAVRLGLAYDSGPLRVVAKGEYFNTTGDGAITQNHGLFSRQSFDLSLDNEGFIRARAWSGTLRADFDLGRGKLTNVFGYRRYMQRTSNDIDSTPSFLFHSGTGLDQQQWSDELRYAGRFGAVDLTLGGYLFHQDIAYTEDRTFPPGAMSFGGGRLAHDVYGLFAAADVELAPKLTLNTGLRWSREVKDAAITFIRPRPACSVLSGTCPVSGTNPSVPGETNGFADRRGWSNFAPRLGLSWKPADTALAYASWSRGFRSGGYNVRIAAPAAFLAIANAAGSPAYGVERVDSFELGLKLQTADRRGTLNLAAYQSNVDNMQREIIQAHPTAGTAQSIFNTADTRIRGAEAEARFAVTPKLQIEASLGYINARYQRIFFDISGNGSIGPEDFALEVPRAPRWTWGLGMSHELALGETAKLNTRLDFQHRSRIALTDSNVGYNDAADFLDGSLALRLPHGWSVTVYGKNLLDEVQFAFETPVGFGAGPFSDGNNRPFDPNPAVGTFAPLQKGRVVGVELGLAF